MAKKIQLNSKDPIWLATHFKRLVSYLDETRIVMAMICVEKDDEMIEKYDHYEYLVDLMEHTLSVGHSLLELNSDKAFQILSGKETLKQTLATLQSVRDKETKAGDLSVSIGHWDGLTAKQLAEEIEKFAEDDSDDKKEEKQIKKTSRKKEKND